MATATEISQRALKRLGLVNAGETASAASVADAQEALSAMLSAFEADGFQGDTLPLDARFEQGLIAMLAVRLAEDYGVTPGAVLLRDAERGESQLQAAFFAVPRSSFDAQFLQIANRQFPGTTTIIDQDWAPSTVYEERDIRINNKNRYEVTAAGTSASSGGPTGTGSVITDGTVTWCWRGVTA